MTILKVPTDVATSPHDSGPLTFDTETKIFKDASGNLYGTDDLAVARPGNHIKKWVRENYPLPKGDNDSD
jgi:hypothetical protein